MQRRSALRAPRSEARRPRACAAATLWAAALALAAFATGGAATGLGAQTPETLLEQARQARDSQQFAPAAQLVERYLEARPGDAGAWWMLGQLRYWMSDAAAAVLAYERALALTPGDPWLRVDFARTLVGLGRLAHAQRVLDAPETLADTAARVEAERIRSDVRSLTAPWLSLGASGGWDDQPRSTIALSAELGVFLTPVWTASVTLIPRMLDADGVASTRMTALATSTLAPAGGRWTVRAGGGAVLADEGARAAYSVRGALRVRPSLSIWSDFARASYEWTLASLDSVVMSSDWEVALDGGGAPRWAGAAHWRRSRFDDGNSVASAFGWLLAPLSSAFRAGYAVAWQDAQESRWQRDPARGSIGREGADTIPGRYAPYYTPDDVTTHTLLAEASARVGDTSVKAQGGYAVHGREQAPVLLQGSGPPGGPTSLTTYTRSFSPWNASLSVARSLTRATRLEVQGEYRVNTYYRFGRVSVGLHTRR